MTPDEIARLRALCDWADRLAPAPWRIEWTNEPDSGNEEDAGVDYIVDARGDNVIVGDGGVYPPHGKVATFIAAARTALPAALDRIESLERDCAEIAGEVKDDLIAVTSERDALRADVEQLRSCPPDYEARWKEAAHKRDGEIERLTGAGFAAMNPATVAMIIAERDALTAAAAERTNLVDLLADNLAAVKRELEEARRERDRWQSTAEQHAEVIGHISIDRAPSVRDAERETAWRLAVFLDNEAAGCGKSATGRAASRALTEAAECIRHPDVLAHVAAIERDTAEAIAAWLDSHSDSVVRTRQVAADIRAGAWRKP